MMTGGRNVMKTEFKVQGMTCGGCERSVQNALTSHKGVTAAKADRVTGTVAVEFDPSQIEQAALAKAITAAGFQVAA
jgi:copper chaperone CopZ